MNTSILFETLRSTALSTVLIAILVYIFKNWIAARISKSIEHEYKLELTKTESKLRQENDIAISLLKSDLENTAGKLKSALESFSNRSKKLADLEFEALDKLWNAFLNIKSDVPSAMIIFDAIKKDELPRYLADEKFRDSISDLQGNRMISSIEAITQNHEPLRPYIDEYGWAIFSAFQMTMVRIRILIYGRLINRFSAEWYEDEVVQALLKSVFIESEYNAMINIEFNRFRQVTTAFELKIIAYIRNKLAGDASAGKHAKEIQTICNEITKADLSGKFQL